MDPYMAIHTGLEDGERTLETISFSQLQAKGLVRCINTSKLIQPMHQIPGSLLISTLHGAPYGKGAWLCPLIPVPPVACLCPIIGQPGSNFVDPNPALHRFPSSISEIISEQTYRDYIDRVNAAFRTLSREDAICCGLNIDVGCMLACVQAKQRRARYDAVLRVTTAFNEQWGPQGLIWLLQPYKLIFNGGFNYQIPEYWALVMNPKTRMSLEMSDPHVPQVLTRHFAKIQARKDQAANTEAALRSHISHIGFNAPPSSSLSSSSSPPLATGGNLEAENAALRAQLVAMQQQQQQQQLMQSVPAYPMTSSPTTTTTAVTYGQDTGISAPYYYAAPPLGPPPQYSSSQIEGQPHQEEYETTTLPGQAPKSQTMQ